MSNNTFRVFLQFIKVSVALPVTFLCFAGYYLYSKQIEWNTWFACLGVYILSAASSGLNQIIEQKFDSLMYRTKNRPLPSGKMTRQTAWLLVLILGLTGTLLLLHLSVLATCLGLLAITWYVLVYTLLKRITPFATIPGAITGTLPLLIGFTASGGSLWNPHILLVAAFIFVWQVPHFWLLMMAYGDDYEKAGFPTLFRIFSERNLKLWTLGWIITATIFSFWFIPFGVIHSSQAKYIIIILGMHMAAISAYFLLFKITSNGIKRLFHLLNFYMLLVILAVLIDPEFVL